MMLDGHSFVIEFRNAGEYRASDIAWYDTAGD